MDLNEIKALDGRYYMGVFGERLPAAFARGEGVYLIDQNGKRYLDLLAGIAVNALGYSDEGFKSALKEQVDALIHTSNYFYNQKQAELAQTLCVKTGMDRVFLGNSGAEANECAIKLAKKRAYDNGITDPHFVSVTNSFHGRTVATLSSTGQEKFRKPFSPGPYPVKFIEANDETAAKYAVTPKTCGVILEVVQGEGGVNPLKPDYVRYLRALCDANGALMIVDEIQTGMGRTGTFLAIEQCGVHPDIVTLAKALGGGVPIGACLATEAAAAAFGAGDHGSTFGGNYLACAAGLYMANAVTPQLLKRINELGNYFKLQLTLLMRRSGGAIKDVRGLGLMLGAELSEKLSAANVKRRMFEEGVIITTAGANTLRFLPPYVIDANHIDSAIIILEKIISEY